MEITKIQAYGIRCPEPNDLGRMRHTVLVRVDTSEGHFGWGEGITMWLEATNAVVSLINNGFSDLLIGQDPLDIERLWNVMREHLWWYGGGGLSSFAVSAIDIALWDIKGKVLNTPLYELLGGKIHERLPACASIHAKFGTHEENVEEIAAYMDEGFQSVKVGFGKKGPARLGLEASYDTEFVSKVRERIGADKGLILDIGNNIRWTIPHAVRMARVFEEYNVLWVEEPFLPNQIDAHLELRSKSNIWIGAGEREWNYEGYYRLLKTGVVDVIGIDPARVEGITGFQKVRELVAIEHRLFNAHAWSTGITSAASLHLSISSKHCLLLELKPLPNPMQNELILNSFGHKDGWIYPLEGPGLGIEVDESAVQHYQFV